MKNFKRIVCILLTLCFIFAFTSCGDKTPQGDPQNTTNNTENKEISVISLNKEYISDYEWYKDTSTMLVRSEYTDITLDKAMEKDYPLLAQALSEASAMRRRAMEDEKDNFIALATDEFESNNEAFSTYVSALDVQVRRADSVVVSILEDYGKENSRSFNGLNYDTESGKELAVSDAVTDIKKVADAVEKEVKKRIGQGDSDTHTAVPDYFSNTPEDSITWTLDYNGVTFYFDPGDIAPTNFGVQTVTVSFTEYPDLFNEKYTAVPDAYVAGLSVSSVYFTDISGDNKPEELTVSGYLDDAKPYHTISINFESSDFKTEWFSYIEPYYVKTKDGKSYICIYNLTKEEEGMDSTLYVYTLENGKTKLFSTSETGLVSKGENIFALPADPSELVSVG